MTLLGSSVYGIRRYSRGSWLATHVDKMETHVVSVIINVAQKGGEPWPLIIADHQGGVHRVRLSPGQMLLYESARLAHGRPSVLTGQYYDNIFVHYKPRSRSWWRVGGGVRWDLGETPPWRVQLQTDKDTTGRNLVKIP